MNIVKTFAVAAVLFTGVSAANAATLNSEPSSGSAIGSALSASVLTVNDTEARLLKYDNDVASIQALINGNRFLVQSIEAQGFSVENIVGASGDENGLTLFAI
ncbi:MAG: hypothetical protein P0Y65_17265 [Candidatus Devosia phytovorans]|uniref:Uncharacterized protein n=1 Tax=Candidatus Devosia phytovorans TaxID=3121372 RepID=A0AAJ6AYS7_9HYPH|nr:hypothetical protein [Devosia sp.]WEK03920.1 MAG: hypothetical protein P0Y65_17265 [Devosia sp.]